MFLTRNYTCGKNKSKENAYCKCVCAFFSFYLVFAFRSNFSLPIFAIAAFHSIFDGRTVLFGRFAPPSKAQATKRIQIENQKEKNKNKNERKK